MAEQLKDKKATMFVNVEVDDHSLNVIKEITKNLIEANGLLRLNADLLLKVLESSLKVKTV
jgi:hypothetical protein